MKYLLLFLGMVLTALVVLFGKHAYEHTRPWREETTATEIRVVGTLIEDFKHTCGAYPTTVEGLEALVHSEKALSCKNWKKFISNGVIPVDAWGVRFKYESDGQRYRIEASHGVSIAGP